MVRANQADSTVRGKKAALEATLKRHKAAGTNTTLINALNQALKHAKTTAPTGKSQRRKKATRRTSQFGADPVARVAAMRSAAFGGVEEELALKSLMMENLLLRGGSHRKTTKARGLMNRLFYSRTWDLLTRCMALAEYQRLYFLTGDHLLYVLRSQRFPHYIGAGARKKTTTTTTKKEEEEEEKTPPPAVAKGSKAKK
jgi:hypothetical protein